MLRAGRQPSRPGFDPFLWRDHSSASELHRPLKRLVECGLDDTRTHRRRDDAFGALHLHGRKSLPHRFGQLQPAVEVQFEHHRHKLFPPIPATVAHAGSSARSTSATRFPQTTGKPNEVARSHDFDRHPVGRLCVVKTSREPYPATDKVRPRIGDSLRVTYREEVLERFFGESQIGLGIVPCPAGECEAADEQPNGAWEFFGARAIDAAFEHLAECRGASKTD
jgi:hypothetical protein